MATTPAVQTTIEAMPALRAENVLVTGGSSGIGQAIAVRFAEYGANVAIAPIYGAGQVTLPALEIAPPAMFWPKADIAIDAFHHAVYATATGLAYRLIDGGR